MLGENNSTLVLGEAPESDDECDFEESAIANISIDLSEQNNVMKPSATGSEVLGEAAESDEEVIFHNETSANISNITCSVTTKEQYPPSVKKLRQKNKDLSDSLGIFKKQIFSSAKYELNNINQQLLKSQVELQQTLMNLRVSKSNLIDYKNKFHHIIAANYIPTISLLSSNSRPIT